MLIVQIVQRSYLVTNYYILIPVSVCYMMLQKYMHFKMVMFKSIMLTSLSSWLFKSRSGINSLHLKEHTLECQTRAIKVMVYSIQLWGERPKDWVYIGHYRV